MLEQDTRRKTSCLEQGTRLECFKECKIQSAWTNKIGAHDQNMLLHESYE